MGYAEEIKLSRMTNTCTAILVHGLTVSVCDESGPRLRCGVRAAIRSLAGSGSYQEYRSEYDAIVISGKAVPFVVHLIPEAWSTEDKE